mmetsp:Transcript_139437/g.242722  ORF Transcript_139437/g.242722 Transcript_139437/m.242722 type:complete len:193 (+) Transcript_139437:44-622(+)
MASQDSATSTNTALGDGGGAGEVDRQAMVRELLSQLHGTETTASTPRSMLGAVDLCNRIEEAINAQSQLTERLNARAEDVETVVRAVRMNERDGMSAASTGVPESCLVLESDGEDFPETTARSVADAASSDPACSREQSTPQVPLHDPPPASSSLHAPSELPTAGGQEGGAGSGDMVDPREMLRQLMRQMQK